MKNSLFFFFEIAGIGMSFDIIDQIPVCGRVASDWSV